MAARLFMKCVLTSGGYQQRLHESQAQTGRLVDSLPRPTPWFSQHLKCVCRALTPGLQGEAEVCFRKAIEVAQQRQAKSLELWAVMSLIRLRQQQVLEHGAQSMELGARTALDEHTRC